MKLRPHHLFCVQGYKGEETDDEYLNNLRWLATRVWDEPYLPVEVVDGPDDVCTMCPYMDDGVCKWDQAGEAVVRAHDAALLKALGLVHGQVTSIAGIRRLLESSPETDAAVRKQCEYCPWIDKCAFIRREV